MVDETGYFSSLTNERTLKTASMSDPRFANFENAIKQIASSTVPDGIDPARWHFMLSTAAIGELFSDRQLRTIHALKEDHAILFTFHGTNRAILVDMLNNKVGVLSVDAPLP